MVDTLKRLAGPTLLTGTAATLYTVPAATTTTVTNIHVGTTSGGTLYLSIGTYASATRFHTGIIDANDSYDWSGTLVLAAGEFIQGLSPDGALVIVMSGVETT